MSKRLDRMDRVWVGPESDLGETLEIAVRRCVVMFKDRLIVLGTPVVELQPRLFGSEVDITVRGYVV